jgi:hypothetical protein
MEQDKCWIDDTGKRFTKDEVMHEVDPSNMVADGDAECAIWVNESKKAFEKYKPTKIQYGPHPDQWLWYFQGHEKETGP